MSKDLTERLQRKVQIWKRMVREKPRFLLGYFMQSLMVRAVFLSVYAIFPWVFSSSFSPEGALRQLSFDSIWRRLAGIPADIRNLLSNLSSLFANRGKLLLEFLKSLWPPHMALRRFLAYARQHIPAVRKMMRLVLGAIIGFLLFRIVILLVIPLLGLGALTILGLDIGVAVIFLVQSVISWIAPFLGKMLHGKLLAWHRYTQEFIEQEQPAMRAEAWRDSIRQRLQGYAERYMAWVSGGIEAESRHHQDSPEIAPPEEARREDEGHPL